MIVTFVPPTGGPEYGDTPVTAGSGRPADVGVGLPPLDAVHADRSAGNARTSRTRARARRDSLLLNVWSPQLLVATHRLERLIASSVASPPLPAQWDHRQPGPLRAADSPNLDLHQPPETALSVSAAAAFTLNRREARAECDAAGRALVLARRQAVPESPFKQAEQRLNKKDSTGTSGGDRLAWGR